MTLGETLILVWQQSLADVPCEPRGLRRHFLRRTPTRGGTGPLRSIRCNLLLAGQLQSAPRISPEKSASRPESADLPHLAQSLFPRTNPAWVLRTAILPWVKEPVDSATAYVRNGIASEAHVRNGRAKGRGRPYGGKFMRRRRSLQRGLRGEPRLEP
jgi:hypothetical protein